MRDYIEKLVAGLRKHYSETLGAGIALRSALMYRDAADVIENFESILDERNATLERVHEVALRYQFENFEIYDALVDALAGPTVPGP
jgi:hypothetical protein